MSITLAIAITNDLYSLDVLLEHVFKPDYRITMRTKLLDYKISVRSDHVLKPDYWIT